MRTAGRLTIRFGITARAVSALSINDNTLSLSLLPGNYASDPARMTLTPAVEYYEIDNRVRTVTNGGKSQRKIVVERLPGARQLRIWGTLPLNDPGDTEVLGIEDPALYAAHGLARCAGAARDHDTRRGARACICCRIRWPT